RIERHVGQLGSTGDLGVVVDGEPVAVAAAERPKIGERRAVPHERVHVARCGRRGTSYEPGVVDAERIGAAAAERSEVDHRVGSTLRFDTARAGDECDCERQRSERDPAHGGLLLRLPYGQAICRLKTAEIRHTAAKSYRVR